MPGPIEQTTRRIGGRRRPHRSHPMDLPLEPIFAAFGHRRIDAFLQKKKKLPHYSYKWLCLYLVWLVIITLYSRSNRIFTSTHGCNNLMQFTLNYTLTFVFQISGGKFWFTGNLFQHFF